MGVELPKIPGLNFEERLQACSPIPLLPDQVARLQLHYEELRRWNRRVSMVGPVAAEEIVERHYGESLAALPFLSGRAGVLLDVGSGAGFPGFVLAAVRPQMKVILLESKGRKWSFLKWVCAQAGLSTTCLNARVGRLPVEGLPRDIDWVTARAVRFQNLGLAVLLPRLTHQGAVLFWGGRDNPELPEGLEISRQVPLPGSESRRIIEITQKPKANPGL